MKISAGLNTLVSGPFGGRRQRYESLVSSEANTSSRKVDAADGLNGVHTASSTMKLSILKLDGTSFDVTVHNNASVGELKAALETTMNELERAELGYCDIQWAQVWGHFCLCYMNQMLIDDSLMLSEIGIQLDDQLHFVRHLSLGKAHHMKRRHFLLKCFSVPPPTY
ncbi:hypothetical protein O6H91_16G050600 [Diphasiastrum complanatum]|uniref:Uncharacterized protein n=1 Tax=Diphasiastrum complanatum TaxID=34168 RepID=A0ACC2BC47_DIPCM|nr:hypothetical protein O6H91_16G050600 [Diphasiastrum complanatum]